MVPPIKWSFEVEIKTEKQADSIVDALDEQERKKLLDALNKKMWTKEEKKESKETIEKTPELDKENFRIDSTNWKEITDPNGVKVKENPEGDVREYVEGKYKWDKLTKQEFQWAKEQFYGKSESTEKKEHNYEHLLNKPGMTPEDNANMEKSIKFLVDNQKDTSENIKKLEAVKYGSNYREIAGLKFSREKVVPQVKFNDKPNKHGVFECKEKGIYKTIYNGKDEYHLTTDQYIDQTKKQWMTAIEDSHLRQALRALPWDFKDNEWYVWSNILWNILDLSMSGSVHSDGTLWYGDGYGYLSSASPVDENSTRAFEFDKDGGLLDDHYYCYDARPCLSLIK